MSATPQHTRFPAARSLRTLTSAIGASLLAALSVIAALVPSLANAQDPPAASDPSGSARLIYEGKQVASVGFSLRADGPRFALEPVARVLGVELRIGPLGDAHTLLFDSQKVIVGPDSPSVVVVSPDGSLREELARLDAPPIKTVRGLEVPLGFLELTFGDELGFEFDWSFRNLQLELRRRDLRKLEGSVKLVHQHRASTVEILFSESPRYRFESVPGAVEVRLVGDSFELSRPFSRPADPLVTNIVTSPTRIRIELTEDARAFEPRLVPRGGAVSMVIDVLRQKSSAKPTADREETSRRPIDPLPGGIRTIVIDPGHGGEETGAVGANGTLEKELNLVIARLLATRLKQRMPVRVVLTRDSDVDLPLEARVALANENKADLFISLHFNSYQGSRARGAETYFLSREASDQLAARSAEVENRSAATDETSGGDLDLILWDLAQSYHLNESQRFASLVQEELNRALGLRDRGVRQAPFKVLMGANMPSVLVELGFLSNPEEEAKLQSPAYLAQLADALVRAVTRLETQLEARQNRAQAAPPSSSPAPATATSPGGEPRQ